MTFAEIQAQVVAISNVQQQTDLVKSSINITLLRIAEYFEWPFYLVNTGIISTVGQYTTGTVTATNNSKTITGVGTSWTSAMTNRKIRVANGMPYYRIKSIDSATSMTLETLYQGDTVAGATYTIYKDEYRLAPDVDTYKTVIQIQNALAMASVPPPRFDQFFPSPYSYADPTMEIMEGTTLQRYSTGTVTVTVNSTTITGSGTAWSTVEGFGRMSKITVGTSVYTVKSVTDDTNIEIYETPTTSASSSTYFITFSNLMVQVFPIPNIQENLYYRYHRIPTPLINSQDIPDLPLQWHYLLVYGSLSFMFLSKGDIQESDNVSEIRFREGLQQMKSKLGSYAKDRKWRISSQDIYVTTSDGLEKTKFDRRWSSP